MTHRVVTSKQVENQLNIVQVYKPAMPWSPQISHPPMRAQTAQLQC